MRVYIIALAVAEILAEKVLLLWTVCGVLYPKHNLGSPSFMKSKPSYFINDEPFSADFISTVSRQVLYYVAIIINSE